MSADDRAPKTRRLFLGIPLPERAAADAVNACAGLRGACRSARWTREENLHATVLFLGDVEDGQVAALIPAFRKAFETIAPFGLSARGIVPGPPTRHPTMLWIGFADSAEFAGLSKAAYAVAAAELDLPPLREDAAPHATLARFRDGLPAPCAQAAGRVGYLADFTVDRCMLFESYLSSDGPTYVALESFVFGRA